MFTSKLSHTGPLCLHETSIPLCSARSKFKRVYPTPKAKLGKCSQSRVKASPEFVGRAPEAPYSPGFRHVERRLHEKEHAAIPSRGIQGGLGRRGPRGFGYRCGLCVHFVSSPHFQFSFQFARHDGRTLRWGRGLLFFDWGLGKDLHVPLPAGGFTYGMLWLRGRFLSF